MAITIRHYSIDLGSRRHARPGKGPLPLESASRGFHLHLDAGSKLLVFILKPSIYNQLVGLRYGW